MGRPCRAPGPRSSPSRRASGPPRWGPHSSRPGGRPVSTLSSYAAPSSRAARPWTGRHAPRPTPDSPPTTHEGDPMSVTLQLPSVLAKLADGRRTLEAQGTTLGDVVADVAARFPGLAPRLRDAARQPYPFVTFYVNQDDARVPGGFAAGVRDGDEIIIVPAIAGG